jgi:hypothetical protein
MPLLSEDIKPATDIIRKSTCPIDLSDCLKQLVFFTEKLLGNTVAVLMSENMVVIVFEGSVVPAIRSSECAKIPPNNPPLILFPSLISSG